MTKLTIDDQLIECRDGIPVLQAALEAGWDVPHYCYHPSLSIVASCRLCLMEMQAANPKTGEMAWMPKLVPSCQTPVKDGMVVRFKSEQIREAREHCMEYFLLNHPLDCPVCDQAGECYLQDYSYRFGEPASRLVDQKLKNPKKDIGPKTLLYQDRCVMCTRCVRFTDEIAGTHELTVVNRGSRGEIDVFPGLPLDNPLQGNVVDLCPVGCLLDKDFLFKQRVWLLKSAKSVCPGCSTGCSIRIDQNENRVYRLKPRWSPQVNDHWICDEGRFGWRHLHDPTRITSPLLRRGNDSECPRWEDIPEIVSYRLGELTKKKDVKKAAVVLSPMMACEEAWLLIRIVQQYFPDAVLVLGYVPMAGGDQHFPVGVDHQKAKFTIRSEKCPNRRGVEVMIQKCAQQQATLEEFVRGCQAQEYSVAWIVGGYPDRNWVSKELADAVTKLDLLITQEYFPNALTQAAHLVLPCCSWAERDGTFMNHVGLLQPFERAIRVPEGARRDGQYLFEIAGYRGLYQAGRVHQLMSEQIAELKNIYIAPDSSEHQH